MIRNIANASMLERSRRRFSHHVMEKKEGASEVAAPMGGERLWLISHPGPAHFETSGA